MEREYSLCVDVSAGNVESELAISIQEGDEAPFNTITASCGQGTLTLICC